MLPSGCRPPRLLAAHTEAVQHGGGRAQDGGVLSLIQRAEQLGRADNAGLGPGWCLHHGDKVNPPRGSVFYFLEGLQLCGRDVIRPIAEGNVPKPEGRCRRSPLHGSSPAGQCRTSKTYPDMAERVAQCAAPAGTTEYELFCPTSST